MMIAGVKDTSLVDGEGTRFVIFMTGCSHACPGCHNRHMWNYYSGVETSDEEIFQQIKENIPIITGITLSGGDPLYQLNNTVSFLKNFKKQPEFKNLDVWLYTGYEFEDIPKVVRQYCDVIVDGKYIQELPTLLYRGSSNQRIFCRIKGTNKWIRRHYNDYAWKKAQEQL